MTDGVDRCIVLCSGMHFTSPKRMADHHLARALASQIPVLFVDPPISHLTPRKQPEATEMLRRPRLRQVGEQFYSLTPVVLPKPHARWVSATTEWLIRRAIRQALASLGWSAQAVVSTWQLIDVYDACPGALRVYWWLDDPASGAELWGFSRDRLLVGDQQSRRRADLVLAVSQDVVAQVTDAGGRAAFFPNGCDVETMAATDRDPLADDVDLPQPIAGFVGQLNNRTDLSLLEAVADAGISLLLVGPRIGDFGQQRFEALCRRPNVRWVGLQPFERLPAYEGHLRAGLVPYGDNEFNRASFPLKPLEYLAAGRPVVSTSLPGIRWLDTPDITFADDPEAFAETVRVAVETPLTVDLVERRRSFARQHSWHARADTLLDQVRMLAVPVDHGADV